MALSAELIAHYWLPIAPLLAQPILSDIRIIRFDNIWVVDQDGLHPTPCAWPSESAFQHALLHLARMTNLPLAPETPTIDTMLPDGTRVNASIPPRSPHAHATLRVLRTQSMSLSQLADRMIAPAMMAIIRAALDGRLNLLISGETSSGKTTLLRALLRERGQGEAVFVIEDTAELQVELPCAIYHETPYDPINDHDPSVHSIYSALRSAPDCVVVGEIRRTKQLMAFLRVLSTGFRGCMTSIHASPGLGVLQRGEEMLMEQLSFANPAAYRQLLTNHVDLLIHCSARHHSGRERRISHIHWIDHTDGQLHELARLERARLVSNASALDRYSHYIGTVSMC